MLCMTSADNELFEGGGLSNRGSPASAGNEGLKSATWDRSVLIMSPTARDLVSDRAFNEGNWKWGECADGVPRKAVGILG
jgi:hypothetical protein